MTAGDDPRAPVVGTPPVRIEEVREATDRVLAAFERLVPQLSSSPPPGRHELAALVGSGTSTLLIATRPGTDGDPEVVGTLTLVVYSIPTGVRAVIEDVVVDAAARGAGVGAALVRRALEIAGGRGARNVDLTSRPSREAANRLYLSLGFEARETNVYRYKVAVGNGGAPGG